MFAFARSSASSVGSSPKSRLATEQKASHEVVVETDPPTKTRLEREVFVVREDDLLFPCVTALDPLVVQDKFPDSLDVALSGWVGAACVLYWARTRSTGSRRTVIKRVSWGRRRW